MSLECGVPLQAPAVLRSFRLPGSRLHQLWKIRSGDLQKLIACSPRPAPRKAARFSTWCSGTPSGPMRMVATNGHRLAKMDAAERRVWRDGRSDRPPEALEQIRRVLSDEEIEIARSDNHLGFRFERPRSTPGSSKAHIPTTSRSF